MATRPPPSPHVVAPPPTVEEAWAIVRAEHLARQEAALMPSLREPIHPRVCRCAACRDTYG